jgi:sugar O-acyltransferase (sialic acid O-acetyltransferase NeuD family)
MPLTRWSQLVILGAGGHGAELFAYLRDLAAAGTEIPLAGFVDDFRPAGRHGDLTILGSIEALDRLVADSPQIGFGYITALGSNQARQQLVGKVEALGRPNLSAWTLQHPLAYVGRAVQIGAGTCLAPGSIVTTRVRIGRHCILNVKASVSHDCEVGDFANINPGATVCGNVRIGEGCFIGTGATVSNAVSVGAWSIIGAGAVVIRDIPPHVTAVGVPARIVKTHGLQK